MDDYQNLQQTPDSNYPPMMQQPKEKTGKGLAIASLILGILGILCCCIGIGALFGLVGMILGILAIRKADSSTKGLAIAGLIVSIIGLLLGVYVLISFGLVYSQIDLSRIDFNDPEATRKYLEEFSRSMGR